MSKIEYSKFMELKEKCMSMAIKPVSINGKSYYKLKSFNYKQAQRQRVSVYLEKRALREVFDIPKTGNKNKGEWL